MYTVKKLGRKINKFARHFTMRHISLAPKKCRRKSDTTCLLAKKYHTMLKDGKKKTLAEKHHSQENK